MTAGTVIQITRVKKLYKSFAHEIGNPNFGFTEFVPRCSCTAQICVRLARRRASSMNMERRREMILRERSVGAQFGFAG